MRQASAMKASQSRVIKELASYICIEPKSYRIPWAGKNNGTTEFSISCETCSYRLKIFDSKNIAKGT